MNQLFRLDTGLGTKRHEEPWQGDYQSRPPGIALGAGGSCPDAGMISHDLTRIALDLKHPRKLASETELLALRPELQHIERLILFIL